MIEWPIIQMLDTVKGFGINSSMDTTPHPPMARSRQMIRFSWVEIPTTDAAAEQHHQNVRSHCQSGL